MDLNSRAAGAKQQKVGSAAEALQGRLQSDSRSNRGFLRRGGAGGRVYGAFFAPGNKTLDLFQSVPVVRMLKLLCIFIHRPPVFQAYLDFMAFFVC